MINWPTRALVAVRKLFEPLQELDIYVEDKNDEIFYTHLFKRIAGDEVKIARVFSKTGRSSVIEAAKSHNQKSRRALFLIDGDLEFVKGLPPPVGILGLHRLDAYCIENLLMCGKGASTILMEEAMLSEENATTTLNYHSWLNSIKNPLIDLFAVFSVAHELNPSMQTVAETVGPLCRSAIKNNPQLDEEKVSTKIKSILETLEKDNEKNEIANLLQKRKAQISLMKDPTRIISGKDYLLPLLNFHLQSKGCKIKKTQLRFRLALKCDISGFNEIRLHLKKMAQPIPS
ncbi:DUF4435 domain-containing protein [Variovorax sp.]|jgi:hypothetical protein|uniref:DUF4435 domain-containing protein n=1 Tax=Variovorax sp. TaxID=1871043 RepID=UPI0037D99F05